MREQACHTSGIQNYGSGGQPFSCTDDTELLMQVFLIFGGWIHCTASPKITKRLQGKWQGLQTFEGINGQRLAIACIIARRCE